MARPNAVGRSLWLWCCLVLVLLVGSATVASAQQPSVIGVEEDWELVVTAPDSYNDAPQVTCVMSPVGDLNSLHATLELNHHTLPDFVAGGLQLQVWNGETPLAYHSYPSAASLAQNGETITWTQSMTLTGGVLTFEITKGNSVAWGQFGGQDNLKATLQTSLSDLNGYRPEVSTADSGIGFAGNRVQSLSLKAVRLLLSTGDQVVDTQPRVVFVKN